MILEYSGIQAESLIKIIFSLIFGSIELKISFGDLPGSSLFAKLK